MDLLLIVSIFVFTIWVGMRHMQQQYTIPKIPVCPSDYETVDDMQRAFDLWVVTNFIPQSPRSFYKDLFEQRSACYEKHKCADMEKAYEQYEREMDDVVFFDVMEQIRTCKPYLDIISSEGLLGNLCAYRDHAIMDFEQNLREQLEELRELFNKNIENESTTTFPVSD